jgi:hypothetical protein
MVTATMKKMLAEYAKWQQLSKKGKKKLMIVFLIPKWNGRARRLEIKKRMSAAQRQERRWWKMLDLDLKKRKGKLVETGWVSKPSGEDDEAEDVANQAKCGDYGWQDTNHHPSE